MTSNFPLLTLTLLIFPLLAFPPPSHCSASKLPTTKRQSSSPTAFRKLYAFGDSYTDTGNMHVVPPYGMTYFHRPMNRYSDGRLVIDFVAQSLSLLLLSSYKASKRASSGGFNSGANFAVGGATAIEHQFFVNNNLTNFANSPESIGTELGSFIKMLEGQRQGCGINYQVKCGALLDDALIWVGEIGAIDYGYPGAQNSISQSVIQGLAITRISAFLEGILKRGAKYVVVQGMPPTGCLTISMRLAPSHDRDKLGCVQSRNKLSFNHNTLLQVKIQDLRKQFPKSGNGPYNYELLSPCGAPSARACSNPSQYINWDGVHLTEAMNKVVSDLILKGGYCHPSFQYLLNRKKSQG